MKKKLLLLQIFLLTSCTMLLAQQTVIKGKVTDNSGGGLPGVNVVLKGNTSGTSTDQNGEYSLSLPNGSAGEQTLVFSFIGYVKQEIALANRNVIDVKLLADTQNLDEVVVVGYGTTAKKNLTTAISKVDPTKIPTSANNNISELLFGRAAGLQVTQQSSQPGGNISISIRGKGDPLLVIDGVVYPGSGMEPGNGSVEIQGVNRGGLAGLNPNDIESIEFLKDASAAIYGVSAANGVMIITTKKGKAGRMSVSYDGNRSFSRNMPYLKPLNAADYMLYFNQLNVDKYQADRNMAPFGTVPVDLSGYTQKFTDEQIRSAGKGTDWLGQVLRPGSIDNHNISVNGGTEKATYFFFRQLFQSGWINEKVGSDPVLGQAECFFCFKQNIQTECKCKRQPKCLLQSSGGLANWRFRFARLQCFTGCPSIPFIRSRVQCGRDIQPVCQYWQPGFPVGY